MNFDQLKEALKDKLQLNALIPPTMDLAAASKFNLMEGISQTAGVSAPNDFRWRDCEPLLEQASALLDRALADRTLFQTASEKWATLRLDVERSLKQIELTDEEGKLPFETPYNVSKNQLDSLQRLSQGYQSAYNNCAIAHSLFQQGKDTVRTGAANLQYVTRSGLGGPDPKVPWMGPPMFGKPAAGESCTAPDLVYHIANQIQVVETAVREYELLASRESVAGLKASTDSAAAAAQDQLTWDDQNRVFLKKRAQLEKDLVHLKLAFINVTGFLDFKQQMANTSKRIHQALTDSHDRLKAVAKGVTNIYGRDEKLPALDDNVNSFDDIVLWTRRTATWLAAMTRRFHNYVLPISVKVAAGSTWDSGTNTRTWKFKVPETMFGGEAYIRIRGIVGWVRSSHSERLWTINLELPSMTTMIYGPNKKTSLEQATNMEGKSDPIRCRLSGVTRRGERILPEICGATSCYNVNPIGEWSVTIVDALDSTSTSCPDDIELDLYLSTLAI